MSGTSIFNMGRLAGLFAVSGAMLLSGCAAPTVAARVTSFQQWPAGVGAVVPVRAGRRLANQ